MSANDQRPRGQPNHVSNGSGSKEEEAYLQQQPPHPMRAWGEQPSDGGYGQGPMSTAVSDSFFPNYYPPNMSYPFMSQGMGGSEGAWSSGADTMFGMGYDYSNMYSGFGFPFNNWDYSGDYWGSSQAVRKDQRGYAAEDAYYPPEMIPADSYGMVNGGAQPPSATVTATAAPAESQEPVVNVEQGIRDMRLNYRKDNAIPQQQSQRQQQQQPPQQQQHQQTQHHHLQHVVAEGFGGEPPFMMPPSPVSATVASSGGQSSMGVGNSSSSNAGGGDHQSSGQSSSKKTSWAAIASQPARPQLQMRPRTIPRAPVHPGKSHNMDIGTWDTRGNPSRAVPMTMSQPLPNQPPSSIAARYSRQPLIGQRQAMPPPSAASVPVSNSSNNNSTGGGSSSASNSNLNSSSSYNSSGNTGVDSGSNSVVNDNSNAANVSSDSVVAAIGNSADSNNSNNMSNNSTVGNSTSSSSAYSGGYSSNASGNASDSTNNRAVVNVNASMNGIHGSGGDSSSSSQAPAPVADSASSDKLASSTFYNPKEFVLNHKSARYFIIKSYSEDDIHRSIKYSVWCSTDHGNRRLDAAFREREGKGPVYLIYSVNGSGHFCGVAQMMTPVDYNKTTGIWHQDKWKGQIEVKWVYVKDVPNGQLRHIRLENNENKPVTNSRDTQEVPPEKGKQVLRIMHSFKATTSIFDDFSHYEKRQEEDRLLTMHKDHRGGGGGGSDRRGGGGDDRRGGDGDYHSGGGGGGGNRDRGDRDHHQQHNRGGDRGDRDNHNHHRGGNNNNDHHHNYRNDYNRGDRDGGGRDNRNHNQRYDGRGGGDNRNDNRDRGGPRGGFDREIRGRPDGPNDRENRRGGFRQH